MIADQTVNLLLVDDEERNLDALESILMSSGCTFVRARSADEALLALLQHEFAAIILDIKMPGTSGLELAQLIKARRRNEHIPILFLTAHTFDEKDVLHAYDVGGVDYLNKPINPAILRSKVAVFIDLFRSNRALAAAVEALHMEIKQREKAQEELRLAKEELETRVLERTAELRQANRESHDNEERLQLALAVAQVAAWEWDLDSGKMRWSTNPEIVFGFPAGAFGPNARISHAAHPADAALFEAAVQHALQGGDLEVEYRAVRPDGTFVWIAERGRIVHDFGERGTRMVGVSVDLTSRKSAEEALREADRRKDEFLATLAHELRNPIAPIRYAVQVMNLKVSTTPEVTWAIGVIERQTQHMARLIDDLLDVNRITRNNLELRKERVELSSVINAAIETSRPLIDRGAGDLTVEMPSYPIYVQADVVRLAQVFSNLLNNATKYGKGDGPGQIRLTVEDDGAEVSVIVKDSGVGIAPSVLPNIFDMFTQVGRSIEQSQGGLGIGLALAKRLVEMHGGAIRAHSEGVGKGSEFRVILRTDGEPSAQPAGSAEAPAANPQILRRILIADDNVDVCEAFELMLKTLGHDVQTAHNGIEAVEKAELFRPGVIVLDIGMPRLNGYETARRIRQQPWAANVVLIALTGWGDQKDKRQSEESGFNIHLVKPVDPVSFGDLLNTLESSSLD